MPKRSERADLISYPLKKTDTNLLIFNYLNPFDRYSRCKGNTSLILKRTENLLKSVVNDEALVRNHQGWGYFIETLDFTSIRKIGLIYNENEQFLELNFFYHLCIQLVHQLNYMFLFFYKK